MSKFIFIILAAFFFLNETKGQKSHLDYHTPTIWPTLRFESISYDGKYVSYSVDMPSKVPHFFVQATNLSWKAELTDVSQSAFTTDSKRMVFRNEGDSLGILQLGKDSISYISQVADFKLPENGNG